MVDPVEAPSLGRLSRRRRQAAGKPPSITLPRSPLPQHPKSTFILHSTRPPPVSPIVQRLRLALAVRPDLIVAVEGWSALHLFGGNVGAVAAVLPVVGQLLPRDRVVMDPEAEEAPKVTST